MGKDGRQWGQGMNLTFPQPTFLTKNSKFKSQNFKYKI
jgi:hypothetical protein